MPLAAVPRLAYSHIAASARAARASIYPSQRAALRHRTPPATDSRRRTKSCPEARDRDRARESPRRAAPETARRSSSSVELESGLLHDRPPTREVRGKALGRGFRPCRRRIEPEADEALGERRRRYDGDELAPEELDDRRRRPGGREHAVPERKVHRHAELVECGHIGQRRRALCARSRHDA